MTARSLLAWGYLVLPSLNKALFIIYLFISEDERSELQDIPVAELQQFNKFCAKSETPTTF